jgi:hypothetical protein
VTDLLITYYNSLHSSHGHKITPLNFGCLNSEEIENVNLIYSCPRTTTTGHRVCCLCTPLPTFTSSNMVLSLSRDPSVFNLVNFFHSCWFLSRDWLISNVATAQRGRDGLIDWVEVVPAGRTSLVHSAYALVLPTPLIPAIKIRRCMFAFIIDVLNESRPAWDFFGSASAPPRRQRRRMRKPWDCGLDSAPPAVEPGASILMDTGLDPAPAQPRVRPVESSGPSSLASLPSAPSGVEELDPAPVYSAPALGSPLALGSVPPATLSPPHMEPRSSWICPLWTRLSTGPSGLVCSGLRPCLQAPSALPPPRHLPLPLPLLLPWPCWSLTGGFSHACPRLCPPHPLVLLLRRCVPWIGGLGLRIIGSASVVRTRSSCRRTSTWPPRYWPLSQLRPPLPPPLRRPSSPPRALWLAPLGWVIPPPLLSGGAPSPPFHLATCPLLLILIIISLHSFPPSPMAPHPGRRFSPSSTSQGLLPEHVGHPPGPPPLPMCVGQMPSSRAGVGVPA